MKFNDKLFVILLFIGLMNVAESISLMKQKSFKTDNDYNLFQLYGQMKENIDQIKELLNQSQINGTVKNQIDIYVTNLNTSINILHDNGTLNQAIKNRFEDILIQYKNITDKNLEDLKHLNPLINQLRLWLNDANEINSLLINARKQINNLHLTINFTETLLNKFQNFGDQFDRIKNGFKEIIKAEELEQFKKELNQVTMETELWLNNGEQSNLIIIKAEEQIKSGQNITENSKYLSEIISSIKNALNKLLKSNTKLQLDSMLSQVQILTEELIIYIQIIDPLIKQANNVIKTAQSIDNNKMNENLQLKMHFYILNIEYNKDELKNTINSTNKDVHIINLSNWIDKLLILINSTTSNSNMIQLSASILTVFITGLCFYHWN